MWEWLKKLFEPKLPVKQTGFLHVDRTDRDYLAGSDRSLGARVLLENGDWRNYEPNGERQNTLFKFDTKACTTFSFLNTLETQIKVLIEKGLIPQITLKFLEQYKVGGEVNLSDRFLSILSRTTINGNYFPQVADTARNVGLIPQSMFPYGDARNWYEWHDPSKITNEMIAKANEWKEHFDIGYEWAFYNDDNKLGPEEIDALKIQLQQAPLQIAVPVPAYHAIMLSWLFARNEYSIFDSYPPYSGDNDEWGERIAYAFKIIITPKKSDIFTQTLKIGSRGYEVLKLQERLAVSPKTGYFGPITDAAVKKYQKEHGLVADGIVGPKMREALNTNMQPTVNPTSKLDLWCEAIKKHEGWYVGSRSYKNNNPGNIKFVGQKRATGQDSGGFCIFAKYEDGYQELKDMLVRAATPPDTTNYQADMTLLQFFQVYAPSSDNNNPTIYADVVAKHIGVSPDVKISSLIL